MNNLSFHLKSISKYASMLCLKIVIVSIMYELNYSDIYTVR